MDDISSYDLFISLYTIFFKYFTKNVPTYLIFWNIFSISFIAAYNVYRSFFPIIFVNILSCLQKSLCFVYEYLYVTVSEPSKYINNREMRLSPPPSRFWVATVNPDYKLAFCFKQLRGLSRFVRLWYSVYVFCRCVMEGKGMMSYQIALSSTWIAVGALSPLSTLFSHNHTIIS